VVDADEATAGTQITPGPSLPRILENDVDNALGLISYSAGQLLEPFPQGSFNVASIQFLVKAVQGQFSTPIAIAFNEPDLSAVDFKGDSIAGQHSDSGVTVMPGVDVNISLALQGGSRPESGWSVPVTVCFFAQGTAAAGAILTAEPLFYFELTTVKNDSRAQAQAPDIFPGTYDISLSSPHCLTNFMRDVEITAPSGSLDLGVLLEGNANDDDKISIQDFGLLAAAYGAGEGESRFDAATDFDRNHKTNIADFGLLAGNYSLIGPLEVWAP